MEKERESVQYWAKDNGMLTIVRGGICAGSKSVHI